jgi:hypothetical protein
VVGLGITAHHRQVCDGALRADIVGNLVDLPGERCCAGQAENVVDAFPRTNSSPPVGHSARRRAI